VDVLNLLPNDLPVVQGLKLYQRNFTDSRELILTVRAPEAGQAEAAARALAQTLRKETNLTASVLWEPAWMEHPAQAAELIGYLWLNQPPPLFGELTNRLTGTNIDATLADAREQLATSFSPLDLARRGYDPYNLMSLPETVTSGAAASFGEGQNLFASPDGAFRILFVKAKPDLANYRTCIGWLKQVKDTVQKARAQGVIPKDVAIGYTGSPAFVAEISGGMEHDMTSSVGITSAIIAMLFWFFHRRLLPMVWLLVLLAVILLCTLALGGLLFHTVNVVSLGFAGILLGLAVDYGVVHYQEALASPDAIVPEIRRAIGPSIFWAAVTTISAFLVLNFGGLPGLAQLGSLVALGVMLSALVMLFAFLPPLFGNRMKKRREQIAAGTFTGPTAESAYRPDPVSFTRSRLVFGLTGLLILTGIVLLASGLPGMDHTANALRPRNSPAYAALDEIKTHLTQNREPLWLIAQGRDENEIAQRLRAAQPMLEQAVTNHLISTFTLPTPLWPRPDYQAANRAIAGQLLAERETLKSAALAQGFNSNSLVMADAILDTWQAARDQPGVFWPTNEMSRWILEKVAARKPGQFLAAGFIFPGTNTQVNAGSLSGLSDQLAGQGFILSGWELLGSSILQRVQQNLWKVVLPMVLLVLLLLWLAFRSPVEILLSLAVLALSGICLLTVMRLAGWSWNLLNLMALPLMLGSGVDYSIFMQLALRRHSGNIAASHRAVGRALLLCGGTAIAGFGSLSWSTNAGMASLGQVCAVGIASNMLISVYLLPLWWRAVAARGGHNSSAKGGTTAPAAPSSLYCSSFWRLGQGLTRRLSARSCARISRLLAGAYWRLAPHRREVVIQNLLPALGGDRHAAEKTSRQLLENFALKLADLWRYESGLSIEHLFDAWTGWEHFAAAQAQKRGILLLTPHLGNWEFGGPLLTRRGVNLQVITLAEPGNGFTELRQASRARWDIETLVIGEDPFAFVEIIRRLEAGATVALLVDRPPAASSVTVELFGQPFPASIAAAELARASGCVLLPVYLPHTANGYAAHILPAIPYDRAALRKREARQQLTQEIVRAFEPAIRHHLDQWYHFVPVWPVKSAK
jgi:predicted exporter/lauroyl/myristoyl acyltransferase